MRRRWPVLLLVLAPLLALWPGLAGLAVGPFDAIRHMPPWNGPEPAQPWDVLMADSVLQSHVWRTLVLDAWARGQLPLWNPYEFAGTPLLANSQSGGFYPPHVVLGLLHVAAAPAGVLLAWLHLALAGVGTYALVRRLGGSAAGALTAGLSFALSPFMLGWTPLSSVLATVAWIPLALACAANVRNRRSWAALAASLGMMLLAGHLQFAAYGLFAVVLFAIVAFLLPSAPAGDNESKVERPPRGLDGARPLFAVLLACIVGFGLAAPQLLPVLEYSKESHRRNVPTEEGYQAYVASALKPYELATLGHPMALGSPRERVDVGGTAVAAYWPALENRNFAESALSLGAVVFALLFAVPWRRRATWPLAAIGLLSLLLALGTPLNRALYFLVPGWSGTGSPGRVEVLFVLSACALGGLAVDRITERKAQVAAGIGFLAALTAALVLPGLASAEGATAVLRGAATTGALPSLLLALVLAGVAFGLAKRSAWSVPAGAALVAALTHATGLVPFGRPLERVQGDPTARIAIVNDQWQIPVAPNALMPPNLAALSGLHELSGYDSLTSRDAVEMLRSVDGGDPAPAANGNMMFVKPTADPQALANWGVTEVWTRTPMPQLGTPERREGYLAYRLDGPGRTTDGKTVDRYDGLEIEVPVGKTGALRDRLGDGWPIHRAIDSTNGESSPPVLIPKPTKGERVFLRYRPPGLGVGLALGAVAWLTLVVTLAFSRSTRRSGNPE